MRGRTSHFYSSDINQTVKPSEYCLTRVRVHGDCRRDRNGWPEEGIEGGGVT